jgi:hypothetical protein
MRGRPKGGSADAVRNPPKVDSRFYRLEKTPAPNRSNLPEERPRKQGRRGYASVAGVNMMAGGKGEANGCGPRATYGSRAMSVCMKLMALYENGLSADGENRGRQILRSDRWGGPPSSEGDVTSRCSCPPGCSLDSRKGRLPVGLGAPPLVIRGGN